MIDCTKNQTVTLWKVTPKDSPELLEIYNPYVTDTAISFEYNVPSQKEFMERVSNTVKNYPYIAARQGDTIVGYTCAGPFKERAAYNWAVETTIYIRPGFVHSGIGRRLYTALEQCLRLQNIFNANACIAWQGDEDRYLTHNSVEFHSHMGYTMVGMFHKCGYKFHRWYDMVWMEKHLGSHPAIPDPVIPFEQLSPSLLKTYGINV